jgi:hypothetical protein
VHYGAEVPSARGRSTGLNAVFVASAAQLLLIPAFGALSNRSR